MLMSFGTPVSCELLPECEPGGAGGASSAFAELLEGDSQRPRRWQVPLSSANFLAEWRPQRCPWAARGGFAALSSFLMHQLLLMPGKGHLPCCCCLPQGLPGGTERFSTFLSLPEKRGGQGGQNSCWSSKTFHGLWVERSE